MRELLLLALWLLSVAGTLAAMIAFAAWIGGYRVRMDFDEETDQ